MNRISGMTRLIGGCFVAASLTTLMWACTGSVVGQTDVSEWRIGTSSLMLDDWSQEEFDEFAANGIDLLEIYLGSQVGKSDEDVSAWVQTVKSRADSSGIRIWSIHLPFSRTLDISSMDEDARQMTTSEHQRVMRLFKPLGIRRYVIHGSFEPVADDEREARLHNAVRALAILSEDAKKYDAQLAIEVLPRTCIGNTSDEILRIVEEVGNDLKVCFDSNHLLQETPEEFVDRVGDLITHVHISDYDGVDEKHWIPKRGVIDWDRVIDALIDVGYEGPWMYEVVRRQSDDPQVTTRDLVENWSALKQAYVTSRQ